MAKITCTKNIGDVSESSFLELRGIDSISANEFGLSVTKATCVLSDIDLIDISGGFGLQTDEGKLIVSNVKTINSPSGTSLSINKDSKLILNNVENIRGTEGLSVGENCGVIVNNVKTFEGSTNGITSLEGKNSNIKLSNIDQLKGDIKVLDKNISLKNIKSIPNNVSIKTSSTSEGSYLVSFDNVQLDGTLELEYEEGNIVRSTFANVNTISNSILDISYSKFLNDSILDNDLITYKRTELASINATNSDLTTVLCKGQDITLDSSIFNGRFISGTTFDSLDSVSQLWKSKTTTISVDGSSLWSSNSQHTDVDASESSVISSKSTQGNFTNTDAFVAILASSFGTGSRSGVATYFGGALTGGLVDSTSGAALIATSSTLNTLALNSTLETDQALTLVVGTNFTATIGVNSSWDISGALLEEVSSTITSTATGAYNITSSASITLSAPTVSVV